MDGDFISLLLSFKVALSPFLPLITLIYATCLALYLYRENLFGPSYNELIAGLKEEKNLYGSLSTTSVSLSRERERNNNQRNLFEK